MNAPTIKYVAANAKVVVLDPFYLVLLLCCCFPVRYLIDGIDPMVHGLSSYAKTVLVTSPDRSVFHVSDPP